mmetsp:Transcript_79104/g.128183  ORF Transcript_79104/g.128183 Transcript_79104/m.128183 type:complete len:203 (-) Transcript_79104:100-708(-)
MFTEATRSALRAANTARMLFRAKTHSINKLLICQLLLDCRSNLVFATFSQLLAKSLEPVLVTLSVVLILFIEFYFLITLQHLDLIFCFQLEFAFDVGVSFVFRHLATDFFHNLDRSELRAVVLDHLSDSFGTSLLHLGSQPPAQIEGGSRVFGGGKLLKNLINSHNTHATSRNVRNSYGCCFGSRFFCFLFLFGGVCWLHEI